MDFFSCIYIRNIQIDGLESRSRKCHADTKQCTFPATALDTPEPWEDSPSLISRTSEERFIIRARIFMDVPKKENGEPNSSMQSSRSQVHTLHNSPQLSDKQE